MTARSVFALGAGVGIQILGGDLRVIVVRLRPTGIHVLASTVISGFRQRPAAEWGAEYAGFLKRAGAGHLAATVLLPRAEVIVRLLALPGVSGKDLESAVSLQIDALHPYGEDQAEYAWAQLPDSGTVLIGIAHRAAIERYSGDFAEAGIKAASFTFSAAVLYSALRVWSDPRPGGFLAAGGEPGPEAYGESPSRPILSAVLEEPLERGAALAASELRLDPEAQCLGLAGILPKPKSCPADFDLAGAELPYATALAAACLRPALKINLLPAALRSSNSRLVLAPTVALAALLLLLAAALAAQAPYQERRQIELLRAEIARYEPQAHKAEQALKAARTLRDRIQVLDNFRRRTRADLDALQELTRLIEPPAWLGALEMNESTVTISGMAEQAAPLLKLLDNSPYFQGSEFVGQIQKSEKNEVFRIRAQREGAPR